MEQEFYETTRFWEMVEVNYVAMFHIDILISYIMQWFVETCYLHDGYFSDWLIDDIPANPT